MGKGRDRRSCWTAGSWNWQPRRRLRLVTVDLGLEEAAEAAKGPRRRCFSEKQTADGVSRLDSSLRRTSMPRCFTAAITDVSLPMSNPTTLIVANCR